MEYKAEIIGEKIRQERKKKSLKQEDFAQALGLSKSSRQTIGNWENNELMPDLEMCFKICKVLGCDMGYLLGEYDFKTKKAKDIYETIKLSEKATEKLVNISKSDKADILITLNKLIESDYFFDFLLAVHLYANTFSGNYIKQKIHGYSYSTEFYLVPNDSTEGSNNEANSSTEEKTDENSKENKPKIISETTYATGKEPLEILSEILNCSSNEVIDYLKASSKVHIDSVLTKLLESIEQNSTQSKKHKIRKSIPLFNIKKLKKKEAKISATKTCEE